MRIVLAASLFVSTSAFAQTVPTPPVAPQRAHVHPSFQVASGVEQVVQWHGSGETFSSGDGSSRYSTAEPIP